MKGFYSRITPVAVMALWLPIAHAMPTKPAARVEAAFLNIESTATDLAQTTDNLGNMSESDNYSPELFVDRSYTIKSDVNAIARELDFLNAHRSLLDRTETEELNSIIPLMHDVAQSAEKAIATLNSDRNHLWATTYATDIQKIFNDSTHVQATVGQCLRLEKLRAHEQQLENDLEHPVAGM